MSSVIVSQSTPNWRIIKQLFLQGAKLPHPPEPTLQPFPQRQIQQYTPILLEMETIYKNSLFQLERRAQESIQLLNLRICALQEEVIVLKSETRKQAEAIARQKHNKIEEEENREMEKEGKEGSLVQIQEEQEESLLEPQTVVKEPQPDIQTGMVTVRKTKTSTNSRKLFEDESASRIKYQPSEVMRPLSTKASAYFDRDKDSREELQSLKTLIESIHGIKLQDYPFPPIMEATVKNIEVEPSKNQVRHLKNENQQLRIGMDRLRMQLQRAQLEVRKVRQLLLEGLEQADFGPYAKSDLF